MGTNFQAVSNAQIPLPQTNCPNCLAADGYLPAFQVVNKTGLAQIDVISTVQNLAFTNKGYQVVVTGHSLGGAVGLFAALELRRLNTKVHFVSILYELSVMPWHHMTDTFILTG